MKIINPKTFSIAHASLILSSSQKNKKLLDQLLLTLLVKIAVSDTYMVAKVCPL